MTQELLQRTADELEIRNAIARLAMLADAGDLDEYASLFTEVGQWCPRSPDATGEPVEPIRGRKNILAAAIQRRANGIQGPGTHMYHAALSTVIELHEHEARARTYLAYLREAQTAPQIALFVIYEDRFSRTAEGWRLAMRRIMAA